MKKLVSGAKKLGIDLDRAQIRRFLNYYDVVTEWNQKTNLTAVTGFDAFQTRHFLDSLAVNLAFNLNQLECERVLDVGTGAGFPGVPLMIAFPKLDITLVDSNAKKTMFLKHLLRTLGLVDVKVITGRAEVLAHNSRLRETFDVVLSRALAKLPTLVELTVPFCRPGGLVIAHKGTRVIGDLMQAQDAIMNVGGGLKEILPVSYEGSDRDSVLVVLEKVGATPEKYPRRVGIPYKRPL